MTLEKLEAEVLALPKDSQVVLLARLLERLGQSEAVDREVASVWIEEAERRDRAMANYSMTTLPEIEAAIKQLPQSQIRQLMVWLQDYWEQKWDWQIEADLASGKLDNLIAKAEADIAANKVRDLDEVLRND